MESSTAHVAVAGSSLSQRGMQAAATAIFLAAAGYTVYSCRAMSGGMRMPGGWTMSMMWMPMGNQSQLDAAIMFIGMWTAMMVAMMLPSAMPMVLLYRRVTTFHQMPGATLNAWLVVIAYFVVWAAFGVIAYALGVTLAWSAMKWDAVSRAVPVASAGTLICGGIYQLTHWKSACLKHCRDPMAMLAGHLHGGRLGAIRLGLHHGTFCALCCWSLMAIQMVLGAMNLVVMILIALVIAAEKLLVSGVAVARIVGIIAIAAGVAGLVL